MKKQLLLILSFITSICIAQTPINSYYSITGAQYAELVSTSTTSNIDQTPAGANAVWNFNQLTIYGSSVDYNPTPTSAELTTYPNTTNVSYNAANYITSTRDTKVYSKKIGNTVSLTGILYPGLNINFSTHNPSIGTFPMVYGYTHSDVSSGTWISGTYSGTFSGTCVTSVDAYGSINLLVDTFNQVFSNVTRYKSEQIINLNYGVLTNIGTVTQTVYSYFDTSIPYPVPVFKSTTTIVNVPILVVVNQTIRQLEDLVAVTSGIEQNQPESNAINIYPNPANDHIQLKGIASPVKYEIISLQGAVLKGGVVSASANDIELTTLSNGCYLLRLQNEQFTTTTKLIIVH